MSDVTAHWDDVPSSRADVGPMGADWYRLGQAAGSDRIGLRRIRISPGKQSTPAHAHFGEEEIFYVLTGSGLSWQQDGVYAIGPGDVILHPPGGPAHTVVAGEEGIDVLAFGDDLRHEAVRFPRIDAAWIGGMIFDVHRIHQFKLEADKAGPVPLPDEPDPRPATIANIDDVEPVTFSGERVNARARMLSRQLGASHTALNLAELAAGSEAAEPHCHSGIEELFVVLDGHGVLLLGDDENEHPVRAGSIVSRRAGTGVPHGFRAGEDGMTLLMYSDIDGNDMCFYPRSKRVLLRGLGVTLDAGVARA